MSDDRLARAARALRETRDGASARSAATRERIVAVTHRRARKVRTLGTFAAALAAVLIIGTAWASTMRRLPEIASWARSALHRKGAQGAQGAQGAIVTGATQAPARFESTPMSESIAPVPKAIETAPPASPMDRVAPQAPTNASSVPPASMPVDTASSLEDARARRAVAASAAAHAAAPLPGDSNLIAAVPTTDPEDRAYAVAHAAHFVAHDPARALQAWDSYLEAYPNGRFALEARYNRALSLIRLGRIPEARAALLPFASGNVGGGGYRQKEAQELLDATAGP